MLIDTHCHLTYPELCGQIDAVVQRARAAGVTHMITVATTPEDARRAGPLLAAYEGLALAAGIHPHEAGKATAEDCSALAEIHAAGIAPREIESRAAGARNERRFVPVAVGEAGLDFHYDFAPHDVQERVFREQIELAIRVGRPLIIHARESEARVCDILAEYRELRGRFVFHCFSGGPEMATRILELGGWLSFTGVVTFKNATAIQAAAQIVPADRMMVETDSPYLSPEPLRKIRPNEPAHVVHTARFLADLRGVTAAALAAQTTENAVRFFALPASSDEVESSRTA